MKFSLVFLLVFTLLWAEECTDVERAYELGVGESKSDLESDRSDDKQYTMETCACGEWINKDIKDATLKITENRVNPATDILIKSLENQLVASDTKIRELVNLKYVNSMYSFYDKQDGSGATLSSQVDGCGEPFNFPATSNTQTFYREGIIKEILSVLHSLKSTADGLEEINKKNMYMKE